MKLRRKKSTLTTINVAQEQPNKATHYARKLYYLILFCIVAYIGSYFINQNMTLKGRGIVVFDTLKLQSPEEGVVYYPEKVEEGSLLKRGDTVFQVVWKKKVSLSMLEGNAKEQYKIQKDISRLKSEINVNRIQRAYLKKSIDQSEELKMLELYQDDYQNKDLLNKVQLGKLDEEYKSMKDEMVFLRKLKSNIHNLSAQYMDINKTAKQYRYVYEQKAKHGDIVKKGEVVAIMEDVETMYIVGYFEQSKLENLKVGETLKVIFPDKKESEGRIKSIATNNKEMDFYSDDLIKDNLMLKVIVEPKLDSELEVWKRYNRMTVKLRKNRWL